MVECNSIECNCVQSSNLDNQQFRLNIINEIKDYFITEIKERELRSKRLSKYYFDKSVIVLSATSGSISIASFATVIGTPVGITSASLSLAFSLSTGLVKRFLKTTINKKKKQNKIVMLVRSKLNSIEMEISEALINNQISQINQIMSSYCLKCRKNTESINTRVLKTNSGKTMILSKCAICGSKRSKFIKEQEAKGLLSNLGVRTPLNKIPLLAYILF